MFLGSEVEVETERELEKLIIGLENFGTPLREFSIT